MLFWIMLNIVWKFQWNYILIFLFLHKLREKFLKNSLEINNFCRPFFLKEVEEIVAFLAFSLSALLAVTLT